MDTSRQILSQLTLLEKAALLSGATTWQSRDLSKKGLPAAFFSDGPTGLRKQEGAGDHLGLNKSVPATCFPTASTVANSWNEQLAEQVGTALGEEAAAHDVQGLLGPGLNIKRNPKCGRNFEYFSEDPHLSGKLAAAYIRGIQSTGVSATPKHFAANSQEMRRLASNSVVDERTLRELYLTGFEIAVRQGQPRAIMSSYNRVNGTYANENRHLLTDILRGEWGFKGMVITDWGGNNDHIAATKAGSDLQMPSSGANGPLEILAAVRSGQLSQEDLDARVLEMIDFLLACQHQPAADRTQAQSGSLDPVQAAAHHEVARSAAREGAVLLKNEGAILPLAAGARVAVIGDFAQTPRYQGAGSSMVNTLDLETTLGVLKNYPLSPVGYAQGFTRTGQVEPALEAEAVELARQADTVLLYLGLPESSETEGLDRTTIDLPPAQLHLLAALSGTGVPIVVVLSAGSVVDCAWEGQATAILDGYLGGEAGASAMLSLICGQYSPSGKLAETFPLSYDDVPFGAEYPCPDPDVLYKESVYVGYRYYDKRSLPVRYPFGHGLSYSRFEYSDLVVGPDSVSFTLTNTGSVDAAEVAQVYVSNPDQQTYHPAQELKGFAKAFLQAGQSTRLTIPFDFDAFRTFNTATGTWATLPGTYAVRVGASSRDIRLSGQVTISGQPIDLPSLKDRLPHYFSGDVAAASPAEIDCLLQGCGRTVTAQDDLLDVNSTIGDMARAKSPLARFASRYVKRQIDKAQAKGEPSLDMLFLYNMPLRAMAEMTYGQVDRAMIGAIVFIVNGHFFRGSGRLIAALLRNRKAQKQFITKISESAA